MEIESLSSGAVNLERIVCFIREALLVETALVAEKCLCWLLLAIESLPNDLFPEVCPNNERFLFPLVNRGWEPDAEKDDAGKTENDADHKKCDYDDQNDDDVSGEDASDYGDEDAEDADYDDYNGDNGSNDGDGDDDDNDDDDDDGSWDDDSNEEDKEEYDEDDEEEETSRPSKKHKSVATSSDDTTGSEYDDDTDDEPGRGSLLKHAREVYNLTSFRIFQSEYKKSRTLNVDVSNETFDRRGFILKYKLRKFGHHFREYTVTAIPFDDIIDCSCKYFDYVGVLCCHALLVLGCLRIEKIPDRYLLKWRTKTGLGDTVKEPCSLIKNNNENRSSSPGSTDHSLLKDTGRLNTEVSEDVLDMHTDHGDAPLLRHARDIYLPNIFLMFREEYKKSEYLFVCAVHETWDHGKIVLIVK
ncbi:Protein FAR1-RELATED SEQUENCE like [Actinidia chinensis var. chinensis]|uniref:Protein FAR1-RELATED SEQUENCE n=1 Tax=Actinidia chinensis var. chinensis TaxID=1590841 RepID=A0A2R6QVT4_ACTCC|nr:Protein FAR1-RELATED SEQUENCE like [Actinidia chinensis var. chinensis]